MEPAGRQNNYCDGFGIVCPAGTAANPVFPSRQYILRRISRRRSCRRRARRGSLSPAKSRNMRGFAGKTPPAREQTAGTESPKRQHKRRLGPPASSHKRQASISMMRELRHTRINRCRLARPRRRGDGRSKPHGFQAGTQRFIAKTQHGHARLSLPSPY